MKNHLRKMICVVAILCFVTGISPVKTEAATIKGDYRIYTTKQNKWYTITDGEYEDVFKIRIPSSGCYLKIKWDVSKVSYKHRPPRLIISKRYDLDEYFIRAGRSTTCLALPKGTYYVTGSHNDMRFQYQIVKPARDSNYCMAKAQSLKAGKNKTLLFDYGYEFPKWYKVKLTSRKRIKIYMAPKDGYGEYKPMVFDSKGKTIETSFISENTSGTKALPKGTYYILVSRSATANSEEYTYADGYYVERVASLTWRPY